jgi:hypothetical protein
LGSSFKNLFQQRAQRKKVENQNQISRSSGPLSSISTPI